MYKLERILVPVDFSADARAALSYAAFLAARFGASIDVLHVFYSPRHVSPEMLLDVPDDAREGLATHVHSEAEAKLKAFLSDFEAPEGVTMTSRLEIGTHGTIAAIANREGHDLIVLGTHGTSRLKQFLQGSLTERTVSQVSCPVLSIHV